MKVALTLEQCWHRVPGGTAVSALGLSGALAERSDVEVIGVSARHRHGPRAAVKPPIPVRSLPLPRLAMYESWHRLRRPRVERATGPVDVIHATGVAVPPATAPLVVTVHDLAWHHEPAHFTARGLRFFQAAWRLTVAEADAVVVPSEATRRDCEAGGLEPGRIRVVPWGVSALAGEPERARSFYELPARFVLFNGTVEPRKNLPGLLAAMERIARPDVPLVLTGPAGWGEQLDALLDRIDRRRVNVVPLGFVAADHLRDLYAAATVFCYPSLREGFGLPVLEAMAQGAPVVTSAGTATAEVAGSAAELVDPADVDAIAGAITALLDDEDRAARLSAAGRARADGYTWARCAAGHADLYHQLRAVRT